MEKNKFVPKSFQPTSDADFKEIRRRVLYFLPERNFEGAKELLQSTLDFLSHESSGSDWSMDMDQLLQTFYSSAFAPPYRGSASKSRICIGMDLLHTQLASTKLEQPLNEIPKPILISALQALAGLHEITTIHTLGGKLDNADAAYRILQRLVSGVGVRHIKPGTPTRLYEKDFNVVLNVYCNYGRMDMAHRVIALQKRTSNAPALSSVSFSILFKGYGKLADSYNVNMLVKQAEACEIQADVILFNSLIDAYINCGEYQKAQKVFDYMNNPDSNHSIAAEYPNLFHPSRCPAPNKRTYNIILKGFANRGLYADAQKHAEEMERKKFWDHVTTNTLVQAAVKALAFDAAETLLEKYTEPNPSQSQEYHPNAEAYTSTMDAFAKRGDMTRALELLKKMKDRGVEPNEFTYTCLIGALAKSKKIDQAKKMLKYMKSMGLRPKVVTYNAFISGLAHRDKFTDDQSHNRHVDEAIMILKEMMQEGIRPNPSGVSVLVGAFGKCEQPRVAEAVALVTKLEREGIISKNNIRISTSLVQVFGAAGDFTRAMSRFRSIRNPDVAAVNAWLDACVRCDKDQAALKSFHHFFQCSEAKLRPDVISYSTMITSSLKKISYEGLKEARKFYEEMKYQRRVSPDNGLVDIILKGVIVSGQNDCLLATDVRFVAGVLRDAEKLEWGEGQLERRKRAVQTIMTGRMAGTWKEESDLYGLTSVDDYEDQLFKKHGWNKVDSGFRLWGADLRRGSGRRAERDDFLQSKGWNNVDSGFRII